MPRNSAEYRAYVTAFMQTRQISSVVDLGCGDFQVSRLMDWSEVSYVGVDAVAELVSRNNRLHATDNVRFVLADIIHDDLPPAELCLLRQVLQHLSNDDIARVLAKLKQYRYVLVTDGLPPVEPEAKNVDKPTDQDNRWNERYGSGLYLEAPPFGVEAQIVLEYPCSSGLETYRTLLMENPASA
ncbi:MAG: class I SAM-dependent methyltransferase [Pseudomonadota bacterium]